MKEHGPYKPPSIPSKERCPASPNGKHCWHVDIEGWEERLPFEMICYERKPIFRKKCCWCGKEE